MSVNLKRIGWKNGTLVSKAKVEINGTIYEVESEQYSGETPLSAENLKQMENNTEEAINKIEEKLVGTVLYENEEGTTGDITLSDSVANYDYIEFQCKRGEFIYCSGKLSNINGKTISLSTNYTTSSQMYVYSKVITVLENVITAVRANLAYFSNSSSASFSSDDSHYIVKVVGYKIS